MNIFVLVLIVLLQIVMISFFIVSLLVFHDGFYIYGIPVHLIFVVLLNILSLLVPGKMYQRESKQRVKFTETTHEEQFRALVASVRSERHDLNNHLTVLSGLLKIKSYDSAENYIKEMIGETRINNQALSIYNPILASMLYSKMDKYQKEGVFFKVNILSEEIVHILPSTDLIRLMSNLLDNAYDAAAELPKGNRAVILDIWEAKGVIHLVVKNTSSIKKFDSAFFEIGYSTKPKDKNKVRGYGLSIIQEITKKYNAKLDIKIENELVCFDIQFPKGLTHDHHHKL
ncbi:sensor histidine kinase [Domibacillus epiphyticus]|uniref:Histidine kinase domain-containing protein n=1 Tax=Domibacillus epiphyticus TaxID=1714355 RepID=A0A1V2A617_9BACI|nr:GHKL domain-containing protein [Domibacillus epiphyticus]OMP66441.1 hypothetical protein BTO28_12115 [Domibacillus epiphyticus]